MKVYYSRWTGYYDSDVDKLLRSYVMRQFRISESELIDPMRYSHKRYGMRFYLRLVNESDIIVYYRLLDNYLSAGVARELEYALENGKKIYRIILDDEPRIIKVDKITEEILTVGETRFLNEVVNEYDVSIDELKMKLMDVKARYPALSQRETLIYTCVELITERNKFISRKYLLKWKLPRKYEIDTRHIMTEIGLIKLDKRGRRIYTKEEKERAIKLAKELRSIKKAAKLLQIPETTIKTWIYKEKKPRKYPRYTIEQYKEAMKLLREGYSIREIALRLGVSESRVKHWKLYGIKPPRAKLSIKTGKELAYTIGTLLSDGSVTKKKSYVYAIQLKVKDREYAEKFSRCVSKVIGKAYKKPRKLNDGRWEIRYSSAAFYEWWRKQNLETFRKYIEESEETMKAFARGFMDGEASSSGSCISVTNTNLEILRYLKKVLEKVGVRTGKISKTIEKGTEVIIKGKKYKANKSIYSLYVNKRDFISTIGFTIKRKNK